MWPRRTWGEIGRLEEIRRGGWLLILCAWVANQSIGAAAAGPREAVDPGATDAGKVRFSEVAEAAGVAFPHTHGGGGDNPRRYYIETMCGGIAFVDYDGDGYLDVYAVNGQQLAAPAAPRATNRLFHNGGDGTFADVTAAAGAGDEGYGMGITAGDYDNDGYPDLYVTNYGPNVLLQNAAGSFRERGVELGVADSLWSVGAAFFDYDNDGDLDLYVANYLDYSLADADRELRPYVSRGGGEVLPITGYPHPDNFDGVADVLYRNDETGFTDITPEAGVYNPGGKGMGLAVADYDDDGDVDIFVANDQTENFLYENRGDGTFVDMGLLSGTAYDRDGRTQSGMGADFADFNGDGRLDLFLTVYQSESNALYHNDGDGFFTEVAFPVGLARPSFPYVSWGTVFLDYDNDGFRDLFVANGHVLDNAEIFDSSAEYAEPNQLFRNLGPDAAGNWHFEEVGGRVGPAITEKHPSRGVAAGDYDNDGDVDLLLLDLNERARLLRNDGSHGNHWLTVRAVGTVSNRDGVGARVRVVAGDLTQVDQVTTAGSYLSQGDLRLSFGLGRHATVDTVEVRWPSGAIDRLGPVAVDQIITITEGRGL